MLDNLTKEQRFRFLQNELSYDPLYMKDMDISYHNIVKAPKLKQLFDRIKTNDNCIYRQNGDGENNGGTIIFNN